MNKLTLSVLVFMFISCSTENMSKKAEESEKFKEAIGLIDKERYEEAKNISVDSKREASLISKIVDASNFCIPVVKECEQEQKQKVSARDCLSRLKTSCVGNRLTPSGQQRISRLTNQLSALTTMIARKLDISCDDGMMWGYIRNTKSDNIYANMSNSSIIKYEKLYGKFESKTKCEESRLLEDDKIVTSSECHRRYLGRKKTISLFSAVAMIGNGKKKIYFQDKSRCQDATLNGIDFSSQSHGEVSVSAQGSEGKNRFIKICDQEDIIVCEQFRQGELFSEEII